ncbi:WRKY transcription factor 1 isoform X2 [Diospyros lotus]|uniref:WRKY transcription factor 1 isoform X2 n=1 Tax=Diospyros lotus TaxID=55363 RepID=UPI00224F89E3|nr:WRKY transcription factor 1 isoform X2 [Diospyros lotus]
MVILGEAVQDDVASDKAQQRESPNSGSHESESQCNQEGNTHAVLPEKESGELQNAQDTKIEFSASQCTEEGITPCIETEKVLDNVQERQSSSSTSRDQASQSSQEGTHPSVEQREIPDSTSRDHASKTNQDGNSPSIISDQLRDDLQQRPISDTGSCALQSNHEGKSPSQMPKKVPDNLQLTQSLKTGPHKLQRDQEGRTPSRIPDKASHDGYNWRKYGQKLVKGNEFIRSYYRCTHPNCPAKRRVERSQGGVIVDNIYLGKHEHPKPQASPQIAVGLLPPIPTRAEEPLAIEEDKLSSPHGSTSHQTEPMETPEPPIITPTDDTVECATSQSNRLRDEVHDSGNSESKKQKREICIIDKTPEEKPTVDPRVVVQTVGDGEVDIVNDGYRWRKYGQKLVKGNPNPRSYYRCSNAGCPAKKHVERASYNPKSVITTYGGQHDHDMPPARTVTPNTTGASTNITAHKAESESRPEEKSAVVLDMAVHAN